MSSIFRPSPTVVNMPAAPTPLPPTPMPDPFSPSALNAQKMAAAMRAGRSSTQLTQMKAGMGGGTKPTLAGGGAVPYAGVTLGGGR